MSISLLTRFGMTKAAGGGEPAVVTEYGVVNTGSLIDYTYGHTLQRGWSFTKVGTHDCVGARIRMNHTTEETVRLWRVSDSALLASVNIFGLSAAWAEGMFATPVTLEDGAEYIIATRRANNASRQTAINFTTGNFTLNTARLTQTGYSQVNANTYPGKTGAQEWLMGVADVILEVPA